MACSKRPVQYNPNMAEQGRMKLESQNGRKQEEALEVSTELSSKNMAREALGSMVLEEEKFDSL